MSHFCEHSFWSRCSNLLLHRLCNVGCLQQKVAEGLSSEEALNDAWLNAKLMVMVIGITKGVLVALYALTNFTKYVDPKIFKGCLLGIGVALLAMNNLIGIFQEPLSGLIALFVFLMMTLPKSIQTRDCPDYIPDIVYSIACALPAYYILASINVSSGALPGFDYIDGGFQCYDKTCQKYLLQAVSYGFLVFGGGYSVIIDALPKLPPRKNNEIPDEEDPQRDDPDEIPQEDLIDHSNNILLLSIDAGCTIVGACLGGVIQTTPYIGFSTYQKLNAGTNYSLYFAFFLLIFGATGTMGALGELFPQPILKPIFVLIGINLAQEAFGMKMIHNINEEDEDDKNIEGLRRELRDLPLDHLPAMNRIRNKIAQHHNQYIPALVMALFPGMAHLMVINGVASEILVVLSNGFVFTSILWGLVTLQITQSKRMESCIVFAILSVFSFLGIIHSWNGEVYVDPFFWDQDSYFPCSIGLGYLFCSLLSLVFVGKEEVARNDESIEVSLTVNEGHNSIKDFDTDNISDY
mmetsp:Transcript_29265/g.31921  ORF Transcript_29265/g.31921 Transcript_29265/m.31921 type:complete len:521 (+) Transcript_29265:333-1895(+)|eukprot:CAMPEP_0173135642 /NCGR_PEP_ID=MMETSP1105-20130129/2012_1 /TAXON_ID=2985 /ORGANISM="Ochromonas sp., Strain BG-1" /LENGTH=520 /DNA_ID=CAMNT_0014047677 /DNA_START=213 /DNA_END=1775 /DNA_ORIENTATION=-